MVYDIASSIEGRLNWAGHCYSCMVVSIIDCDAKPSQVCCWKICLAHPAECGVYEEGNGDKRRLGSTFHMLLTRHSEACTLTAPVVTKLDNNFYVTWVYRL